MIFCSIQESQAFGFPQLWKKYYLRNSLAGVTALKVQYSERQLATRAETLQQKD